MKKEEIRKEFFRLKLKGFSYNKCRILISSQFDYVVSARTLKRWMKRLDKGDWDLSDGDKTPHTIHTKVEEEHVEKICSLRKLTGWGQDKIKRHLRDLPLSSTTIKRIIKLKGLSRKVKLRGSRIKWVRWQRKHTNSLWQIDHTDEQDRFNSYTFSIVDDCSRYSLGLFKVNRVTTKVVTTILDSLIKIHGTPREILSDNGSAYGGKSKHSAFDIWCRRRGINHIRSSVHSPTTCGKVERLFKTIDEELEFCNNDFEVFRLRYNHFRPHSSLAGRTPADIYFGQ